MTILPLVLTSHTLRLRRYKLCAFGVDLRTATDISSTRRPHHVRVHSLCIAPTRGYICSFPGARWPNTNSGGHPWRSRDKPTVP